MNKKIAAVLAASVIATSVAATSSPAVADWRPVKMHTSSLSCAHSGLVTADEWSQMQLGYSRWGVENVLFGATGCEVNKGRSHYIFVDYEPSRGNSTYEVTYEWNAESGKWVVRDFDEIWL